MTSNSDVAATSTSSLLSSPAVLSVFLKLSVPMAVGMLLNGVHTIVDAMFIARFVGSDAFAAVSAVFPLQIALVSLAALFSNGASVLLSRSLGAGRLQDCHRIIGTANSLALGFALLVAILTLFAGPWLLGEMGLNDKLYHHAWLYLMISGLGTIALFSVSLVADIHRGVGHSNVLFLTILLGAVSNIALDALFIIALNWGVAGAAFATLLSQGLAWLYALRALGRMPSLRAALRPRWQSPWAKQILLQGLPVTLMYLGGALVMLTCTIQIARLANMQGESLLAAYGILGRVSIFITLPMIAMTHSCQTMTAYHAGAGNLELAGRSVKLALLSISGYLCLMALLLGLTMPAIAGMFSHDLMQINMASDIAQVLYMALPIAGISAVAIATMQALGKPGLALFVSMAKTYLFMIPMLVVLAWWAGIDVMWYAFPGAELMSVVLVTCLVVLNRQSLWPVATKEVAYATGR